MALIISGRRMTNTRAEMSKGSEIYILHSFQFGFLGFFHSKVRTFRKLYLESDIKVC